MCFRNQKNATKDLDLVFVSVSEYKEFIKPLPKLGFKLKTEIKNEYKKMDAASMWDEPNGFRLDLFVDKVCNQLSLSNDMINRSKMLKKYGKLSVYIISNEDIILFKGITEREDDADDIASIIRSSKINWQMILKECIKQSKKKMWYGILLDKLYKIKEKHGIDSPIIEQVEELYRKNLIKNKISIFINEGMKKEEIIIEFKRRGFTTKELNIIKEQLEK